MSSVYKKRKPNYLPDYVMKGHDLCFFIHDILCQLLVSGKEGNFFSTKIQLSSQKEKKSFEKSNNLFLWLEQEARYEDRVKILKATILPAVLSDMLHCIYEALETSRKAKLNLSYMLISKPIQENLYLLESIILDELFFAETFSQNPLFFRPKNAGGIEGHTQRIQKVLSKLRQGCWLDASYIAKLRYDKSSEDSFDGVCNIAMHLFTEHKSIKTEPFNINFIFSRWDEKISQWNYFYSRLPYLLFYIYQVVEYIMESIVKTTSEYMDDMLRRIPALIILWRREIDENYICDEIESFVLNVQHWLILHCRRRKNKLPSEKELIRMAKTGAYPRESACSVK